MPADVFVIALLPLLTAGTEPVPDAVPARQDDTAVPVQEEEEPQYPEWSGTVSVSSVLNRGNTEDFVVSTDARIMRRTEEDRWTFRFFWLYDEVTPTDAPKQLNDRTTDGSVQYDYFLTDRFYAYGVTSARNDFSTDLDLRWRLGSGVGYQLYDTEKFSLATETGVSYVDEEFGSGFEDDFFALRLRYHLDWQVYENLEFIQDTDVNPRLDDLTGDVIATFDNRLNLKIWGKLILQALYRLEFDRTPEPGAKQTDHTFTLGLGWTIGEG